MRSQQIVPDGREGRLANAQYPQPTIWNDLAQERTSPLIFMIGYRDPLVAGYPGSLMRKVTPATGSVSLIAGRAAGPVVL